ncbi:MAG TPA: class I lanthipeptide [Chloroflexota bacterium]|jgi:hypothetical protein
MQIKFLARGADSDHQAGSRKLSLKKETLRQLTDGELRLAAGGGSVVSLSPSTIPASGTSTVRGNTSMSPSTGPVVSVSAR